AAWEDGPLKRADLRLDAAQPGFIVLRDGRRGDHGDGDAPQQQSGNRLADRVPAARHCSQVLRSMDAANLPTDRRTAAEQSRAHCANAGFACRGEAPIRLWARRSVWAWALGERAGLRR